MPSEDVETSDGPGLDCDSKALVKTLVKALGRALVNDSLCAESGKRFVNGALGVGAGPAFVDGSTCAEAARAKHPYRTSNILCIKPILFQNR